MNYSAKVIADSVAEHPYTGHVFPRLTTMEVTFPRFILAEINTHRRFSRNSASSRARSLTKTIDEVDNDPFIPDYWGKHQAGMAAHEEIANSAADIALWEWIQAKNNAVESARYLENLGLHKQLVNRILEPFMWHTALISSTEWDNFFNLRIDPAAQPEIQRTAQEMKHALQHSTPRHIPLGDWHLPYVSDWERNNLDIEILKMVSVSRCARVSYLNQKEGGDIEKDISLFKKLVASHHWSPLEHVATPSTTLMGLSNFDGWLQLRKIVEQGYGRQRLHRIGYFY
jgi:thymidylate synthase ThyX